MIDGLDNIINKNLTSTEKCGRCSKFKGNTEESCKCGRPPIFTKELLEKTKDYETNWQTIFPEDRLPTIEGLTLYLNINRSTIYDWISQDTEEMQEFSNIVSSILQKQSKTLINKGLGNEFNSSITKLMLSKHGYIDKQDVTSDGKAIKGNSKIYSSILS